MTCVSQRVVELLKLKTRNISIDLEGVGSSQDETVREAAYFTIASSKSPQPSFLIRALVLPTLT